MKFYLTLLRRDGKRLPDGSMVDQDRLITARLVVAHGLRRLDATCCIGGWVLGQLWEPVLCYLAEQELVFRGIERQADAGVVQEWRLRPHHSKIVDQSERPD
jgi:hypothetical protein